MLRNRRAAIVERDPSLIALYRAVLKLADYDVVGITQDASTALEIVSIEQPDVLLVDFRLKGRMDGLDLIADAKRAQPEMLAVLITAVSLSELIKKIELVRPDRTLQKPFMVRSLLELLASYESVTVTRGGTL